MNIYISEIFGPTIQGEGALIGRPTVFVRVGGCDYRCQWCDTMYAVDPSYKNTWRKMTADEIMAEIERLSGGQPILVTLSGGNPAIYDFSALIQLGKAKGYTFAMETQGSLSQAYFPELDNLTLSPKPPSAGETFNAEVFEKIIADNPAAQLKIVVKNDADYQWAKSLHQQFPSLPCYLQPCNSQVDSDNFRHQQLVDETLWLVNKTIEDGWFNVTILPQLHVFLWHNQRGV